VFILNVCAMIYHFSENYNSERSNAQQVEKFKVPYLFKKLSNIFGNANRLNFIDSKNV